MAGQFRGFFSCHVTANISLIVVTLFCPNFLPMAIRHYIKGIKKGVLLAPLYSFNKKFIY